MPFPHPSGNERPSYWIKTSPTTDYPPLGEDLRADVCVIGGGIVGITTAYLLAKAGKRVVVLDRERVAMAETGHTTAHLQVVDDTRLQTLAERFGVETAKLVWDGHHEAVRTIEQIAHEHRIACDLQRLDAFLYTPKKDERAMLEREIDLAREIGHEAHEAHPDDEPFEAAFAVRFPNQGKFHPRKYLLGVVKAAERLGARFFEGTQVTDVDEGRPATVRTAGGPTVTADWVVHATNVPNWGSEVTHTKIMPYRTYVIGARVPRGTFNDALYWDTLDPYHYTRVEEGGTLVVLGGEDHRVGTEVETERRFGKLEDHLRTVTTDFSIEHRWSGEIVETEDDLPFIGPVPGRGANELMATGASGTGMTHGTLSGLILAERILGRGTPWDEPYDSGRLTLQTTPLKEFVSHNVHAAKRLVQGALKQPEIERVTELAPGEGAIIRDGLKRVAVCRDEHGQVCALNATCTHMGCTVKWNKFEQSWDCPCHGSRFSATGEVLHGPATDALEPADVPEEYLRAWRLEGGS